MKRAEQLLAFMSLFPDLQAESWDGWRSILGRITNSTRELWCVVGRGGGKSRIASLLATFFATQIEWPRVPGEQIFIAVVSPTRRQSRITSNYVRGFLHSVPELERLIDDETAESITLTNGVVLDVVTANVGASRGRSYAAVVLEEAAFLPTDETAHPDVEILRSIRPGLARVKGSMLIVIGSPYARRGIMWEASSRFGDSGGDEHHVFIQAPTLELNPEFDREEIARAERDDPESAASEYFAQFRSDISGFVPVEVVSACVRDHFELPPTPYLRYSAFADPSGGTHDSFTLAIAHQDGERRILDLLREWKAPCSPEAVVSEINIVLRQYGLTVVRGDRYGSGFVVDAFARCGIKYVASEHTRSELYLELLPLLRSGRCELTADPVLLRQLTSLERRTARGTGREIVDHPGRKDDVANSAAGALVHVEQQDQPGRGIAQFLNGEPFSGWCGPLKWKDGAPWEGICEPDKDARGLYVSDIAARYHQGQIVGYVRSWKPSVKWARHFVRPTWG